MDSFQLREKANIGPAFQLKNLFFRADKDISE
jgi:hypothetical protein